MIEFQLTGPPNLVGDGLLPADFDGRHPPRGSSPQLIVGSQDDDAPDGATFDALNVFQLDAGLPASGALHVRVEVATADSAVRLDLPVSRRPPGTACRSRGSSTRTSSSTSCPTGSGRPGGSSTATSGRTRPSSRTSRSRPRPAVAGVRWYELRNPRDPFIYQQGTYAPVDGVHRWMGSVAMDQQGNMAAGYSVVNGTNVFPGIRYAGRLASTTRSARCRRPRRSSRPEAASRRRRTPAGATTRR